MTKPSRVFLYAEFQVSASSLSVKLLDGDVVAKAIKDMNSPYFATTNTSA